MSEVEEREERFLDALAQLDDNVLQHEYILSFASCLDMLVPEECTAEGSPRLRSVSPISRRLSYKKRLDLVIQETHTNRLRGVFSHMSLRRLLLFP